MKCRNLSACGVDETDEEVCRGALSSFQKMAADSNGAPKPENIILTAGNEAAFFESRQTTFKAVLL